MLTTFAKVVASTAALFTTKNPQQVGAWSMPRLQFSNELKIAKDGQSSVTAILFLWLLCRIWEGHPY